MPSDPRQSDAAGSGGPRVVLQCLGDIALNGLYCDPQNHAAVRDNLAATAQALGPCDLRVGNWESPLWGAGGMNLLKRPRLCTTREAARCILPLGLDVALLATNHTYDCLAAGYANTVAFLDEHAIGHLGAGWSAAEAAEPLRLERRGVRVGLLNYIGEETHPNLPPDAEVALNWLSEERAVADVARLRPEVDVLLVFCHWGDPEGVRYPAVWQRRLARRLIEAGATAVIGGHSHCLQGDEPWGDGHIFYSLGDVLFSPVSAGEGRVGRGCDRLSHDVGVPTISASRAGVAEVRWTFFRRDPDRLTLRPDPDPRRARARRRLSAALRLSDRKLERRFRRDARWCMPLRGFVDRAGGLGPALLSLRPRHLLSLLRAGDG